MINKATADKARAELDHALRALDEARDTDSMRGVGVTLLRRTLLSTGANFASRALDTALVVALRTMGRLSLGGMLEEAERARCIGLVKRVAPTVLDAMLEDADAQETCRHESR